VQVQYRQGDVLFAEGEYSDHVLLIADGEVEVVKTFRDQQVVLGRLARGEFVGEMGVLEGRPRSATVRAARPVVAELLDRDAFLRLISADGETAFRLMVRLSERLSATDKAYVQSLSGVENALVASDTAAPPPVADEEAAPARLTILAGSDEVRRILPRDGLDVRQFPFVVGRTVHRSEAAPSCPIDLKVPDQAPFRMSRLHFWIALGAEGVQVRDRSSTLGTLVNGVGICQHFITDTARLDPGENTITAGGVNSPYVFRVVLE
jgi:CRP/FNR family transcriptional regulator, cyclic AMP receptor protein